MAHQILVRVEPPFIQALVQKSVAVITNLAGRLSSRMLREGIASAQGAGCKKLARRLRQKRQRRRGLRGVRGFYKLQTTKSATDSHGFSRIYQQRIYRF